MHFGLSNRWAISPKPQIYNIIWRRIFPGGLVITLQPKRSFLSGGKRGSLTKFPNICQI
jgi:hypothetical protein